MKRLLFFLCCLVLTPACSSAQVRQDKVFTSEGGSFQVRTEVFRPKISDRASARTVLILLPTGGNDRLERSYAKGITKKGATAILIKDWTGMNESSLDLSIHQVLHERAMLAIETVIEHIPSEQKISLMGTSVGGIFVAVAAGLFDRPDTFFVIAAGAPITDVIAYSDQSDLAKVRRQRMQKFGYTSTQEYAQALDRAFALDPFKIPAPGVGKKLGLAVLTEDTTVPTTYQYRLRELWREPFTIELNHGHVTGIVRTWWSHYDDVVNFVTRPSEQSHSSGTY